MTRRRPPLLVTPSTQLHIQPPKPPAASPKPAPKSARLGAITRISKEPKS